MNRSGLAITSATPSASRNATGTGRANGKRAWARIPQRNKAMVASAVCTIFTQPDGRAANKQLDTVAQALQPHWPAAAELLRDAADQPYDVIAFDKAGQTEVFASYGQ